MITKNQSVRRKLLIANALAFAAASILSTLGWLVVEYKSSRATLVEDLTAQAAVLGSNCTASLSFKDPRSATETLSALRNSDNVQEATVYDERGKLFATYSKAGAPSESASSGILEVAQPIVHDGEKLGTIHLKSDLSRLYGRLAVGVAFAFLVSVVALALGSVLLSRLQKTITGPIYELLEVMLEVTRNRNYGHRAKADSRDELGLLGKAFNQMIEQIQTRDTELEFHRKHLEEQVATRTLDLERALQAEKRFLASMSHELRTPLNAIIGFGDLLAQGALDPEQRQFSTNVNQSARHMLALVSDILDASKIEAGQMELRDTTEFSLPTLLTECMTIASSRGKEGVRPEVTLPEPPFNLIGDDTRIKQIFINLLSNAYKFTPEGTVRLRIEEVQEADDGVGLVKVSVEDTGVGIDPDRMADLFQPFRQLHNSDFAGTGMGLFISRALARCMGGDIEVSSQKDQGTRFTVTLRLKKGSTKKLTSVAENITDASAIAQCKARYGGLSVLLVEDVEMNVVLAKQVFNRFFGFDPDVARNGLEAIERMRAAEYDLVFMDLQMPKMGGIEATQKIRAMGITTPIVAMTANVLASDIESARSAGMTDYVTKPIQKKTLEAALARVLAEKLSLPEKRAS